MTTYIKGLTSAPEIALIYKIRFGRGYLPDTSFNAWTRYEVDEDEDYYDLQVVLNEHCFCLPEKKIISLVTHELIHCSFYQMHANGLLTDEEAIAVNEMIDDNFPTLYFEVD